MEELTRRLQEAPKTRLSQPRGPHATADAARPPAPSLAAKEKVRGKHPMPSTALMMQPAPPVLRSAAEWESLDSAAPEAEDDTETLVTLPLPSSHIPSEPSFISDDAAPLVDDRPHPTAADRTARFVPPSADRRTRSSSARAGRSASRFHDLSMSRITCWWRQKWRRSQGLTGFCLAISL